MSPCSLVTAVLLTPAPPLDQRAGLVGMVSFEINGWFALDRVPLRRTAQGDAYLERPFVSGRYRQGTSVRVLDDSAWNAIGAQVLAALERQGVLP